MPTSFAQGRRPAWSACPCRIGEYRTPSLSSENGIHRPDRPLRTHCSNSRLSDCLGPSRKDLIEPHWNAANVSASPCQTSSLQPCVRRTNVEECPSGTEYCSSE